MGTIKSKEQSIVYVVPNQDKGKKKYLKQKEKEKKQSSLESSSSTDRSSKYRRRKKREINTFHYFIVSHIEKSFFINKMDIMTNMLEENHIALPEFAKRWECK